MKMKKIMLFTATVFSLVVLIGCGESDAEIAQREAEERAEEIWESLDETSWVEFVPSCTSDTTIIMMSFFTSEVDGERKGTFAMTADDGPSVVTTNVRLYTEDEPSRITIFGNNVHGEEVHFYYYEPVTLRGDELHIGSAVYYREGTNAAEDRMHEAVLESFSCS